MDSNTKNDTLYVMIGFILISLLLVFAMITSFKLVDCCYFVLVLVFATRYLLLSKD